MSMLLRMDADSDTGGLLYVYKPNNNFAQTHSVGNIIECGKNFTDCCMVALLAYG